MNLNLFLCGDVMLGRGIDQLFMHKNNPILYESYMTDARDYVPNSIDLNNPKPYDYIWGDLLSNNDFNKSDLRIINLETSVTTSDDYQNKPVLYRMNPLNIEAIKVANISYCNMANNHVLDWGERGLMETIYTLTKKGINFGGIGMNIDTASAPKIMEINGGRVLIFSYGDVDSGIPYDWTATKTKPGVNVIRTSDPGTKIGVTNHIKKFYQNGDFVIVSIHWGSNWGWVVEPWHEEFAHFLIDYASVDIIHGHSSHHFRPLEIYNNKLILYGCGDMINDYEIIGDPNKEYYLSDISMAYFPHYKEKKLVELFLVPYTLHDMKLVNVTNNRISLVKNKLNDVCQKYGLSFVQNGQKIVAKLPKSGTYFRKKYIKYKNKYLELKNH